MGTTREKRDDELTEELAEVGLLREKRGLGDGLAAGVANIAGAAGAAAAGVCSERLRMCGEPWGYCCKANAAGCKIRRCRWTWYTWALIIGGPIVVLLILVCCICVCIKKSSSSSV